MGYIHPCTPLKFSYKLQACLAPSFMRWLFTKTHGLCQWDTKHLEKRQNFRPQYRCFICATRNTQMFRGEKQHCINTTLRLTKKTNRCTSNPKEQMRWEILIVASVRAGIFHSCHFALLEGCLPSHTCTDGRYHSPAFPQLSGKQQSGYPVDSLPLVAPAHSCCPRERSYSSS